MTERVLPRPHTDTGVGATLRHVFCHQCNGLAPMQEPPPGVPMTSVCRQCVRVPAPPGGKGHLCVVCVDITNTGHCLVGHPLRTVEEMERDHA